MQLSEIDTYKSTLNKFTDTVQYTTMCVQLSSHLSQACAIHVCKLNVLLVPWENMKA